jgi:hypothetical protein
MKNRTTIIGIVSFTALIAFVFGYALLLLVDWRIFLAVAAIIYSHNLGGKIKELHRLEALGKLAKELNKKNVK